MAYTKLDSGITDSTIWQAPDTTRLVWITMLAMADQNGYVGASVPGLAGRARVSIDACITALEAFMAPDKWSRTKDHEGRRIAEADGGWVLLSHAKYRAAQNAEDRRERSRVAMASLRERRKQEATVNSGEPELAKLTQAEAEAKATKKETSSPSAPRFEAFWNAYPRKVGKDAARKAFDRRKPDDELTTRMVQAIHAQARGEAWRRDGGQFIPHPSTWLNEGRWQDEGVTITAAPAPAQSTWIQDQANHRAQAEAERLARKAKAA